MTSLQFWTKVREQGGMLQVTRGNGHVDTFITFDRFISIVVEWGVTGETSYRALRKSNAFGKVQQYMPGDPAAIYKWNYVELWAKIRVAAESKAA